MTAETPAVTTRPIWLGWLLPAFVLAWILIWMATLGVSLMSRLNPTLLQNQLTGFLVYSLPFALPALLGSLATAAAAALLGLTRSAGRLLGLVAGWLAAAWFGAWLPILLIRSLGLYRTWPQGLALLQYLVGALVVGSLCGLIALLALTPARPDLRRRGGWAFWGAWLAAFGLALGVYYVLFIHVFRVAAPSGSGGIPVGPGIMVLLNSSLGHLLMDGLRPFGRLAFDTGLMLLMPSNLLAIGLLGLINGLLMGLVGGLALTRLAHQAEGAPETEPVALDPDKANRQHSGCLSAFLNLAVVANALLAVVNLILLAGDPDLLGFAILSALINLAGAGCAFAVLKWKRWGVYGFVGAAVAGILVSLGMGAGGDALRTIIPIILLLALVGPSWRYMD